MADNIQNRFLAKRYLHHMIGGHPVRSIVTVELEGFPKEASSPEIIESINRRNVLALERAVARQFPGERLLVLSEYNRSNINTAAFRSDKLPVENFIDISEDSETGESRIGLSVSEVYKRDVKEMATDNGRYGKYLSQPTLYYNYLYMKGLENYAYLNDSKAKEVFELLKYDGFIDLYATEADAPTPAEGLNLFSALKKDDFFDELEMPGLNAGRTGTRRFYEETEALDLYTEKVLKDYYIPLVADKARGNILDIYTAYEKGELTAEQLEAGVKKEKDLYVKTLTSFDLDIEIDPDSLLFFGGNPMTGATAIKDEPEHKEYSYEDEYYDHDEGREEEYPGSGIEQEFNFSSELDLRPGYDDEYEFMQGQDSGERYYDNTVHEKEAATPVYDEEIPERIAEALREISEMEVPIADLENTTPSNWNAETRYEGKNSYSEAFTSGELKELAVRLRINGKLSFEEQVAAAHEIFRQDREVRELLYRAGNFDEAEKELVSLGAGAGAKAFMELGRRGLEQIPSPHQMMAIHNLERGETRAIIAVPGSGKTSSLVYIMENAIAEKLVAPNEITAISYTTSAAGELNDRINSRNPDLIGAGIKVSTAHALARSIIRTYAPDIPMRILQGEEEKKDFYSTIISKTIELLQKNDEKNGITPDEMKYELLRKQMEGGGNTKQLESAIGAVHLAPWSEKQAEKASVEFCIPLDALKKVYEVYEEEKKIRGLIDFDDMLLKAVNILSANPRARAEVQAKAKLLIVDEYQDTSPLQYLFESMIRPADGIKVVVGDDDQAIFSILGADKNLLKNYAAGGLAEKMRKTLVDIGYIDDIETEGAKKKGFFIIPKNYRSDREITVIGNAQGRFIPERIPKTIAPSERAQRSGLPQWHQVADKETEYDFICQTILNGINAGKNPEDYAVLFRWNREKVEFDKYVSSRYPELLSHMANFGTNPFVKDFIDNIEADREFRPILESLSRPNNGSLFNALLQSYGLYNEGWVSDQSTTPLIEFEKKTAEEGLRTPEVVSFIKAYKAALTEKNADEAISTFITERERGITGKDFSYEGYQLRYLDVLMDKGVSREGGLEFHALMEEEARANRQSIIKAGITETTYHRSKGREFNTTFLVGLEDKNLDMMTNRLEAGDIKNDQYAETERLVYVGLTRAKHECYMLSCGHSKILSHFPVNSIRYFVNGTEKQLEEEKYKTQNCGRIIPGGKIKAAVKLGENEPQKSVEEKLKTVIDWSFSQLGRTID